MKLAKVSILVTSLLVNSAAFAAVGAGTGGGTITFKGAIQQNSCEIDTSIQTAADFTVTLPTIAASSFTASGQTRGTKQFKFGLKDCPAGYVAGHFETLGGSGWDPATGNLQPTTGTGTASNVQVRLLDSDGVTQIVPGNSGQRQQIKSDGDSVVLSYFAGYYSTNASVSAGSVTASVVYTLDYS